LFNLPSLSFFDAARVPSEVCYLSAFTTLEEGGLKALTELVRKEARERQATLLVIDGLVTAAEAADTDREFKRFINSLQIHAGLVGCTVVLLASGDPGLVLPEHTMVDGVIELTDVRFGHRSERELEVRKFRGSDHLRGAHTFQVGADGVRVAPRLEVLYGNPSSIDAGDDRRLSTHLPRLDEILKGGLVCGSTTLLAGPSGTGKTTLGLQFLSASSAAEPGMLFGFYETPDRLVAKARALKLEVAEHLKAGTVTARWNPPMDKSLDALGNQLLDAVRARGVKRLFIDGLDGFNKVATYPERVTHFFTALANELRVRGVTTLCSAELKQAASPTLEVPVSGAAAMAENAILLRFAEVRGQLYRLLTVMKMRDTGHQSATRELHIGEGGVGLSPDTRAIESPGEARPKQKAKGRSRRS
jgi:circadian clock protein KaiC